MENEKLKVNNSEIFQKIFGKKGNESILKDFVSSILDAQMEKIELGYWISNSFVLSNKQLVSSLGWLRVKIGLSFI